MQTYDTVKYTENGESVIATILEIRYLDHHNGQDGEPLLHLGFFAPVLDGQGNQKKLVGTQHQGDLVQFRIDVAHESHEYDEAAVRAGFKGVYPGGRWSEIRVEEAPGSGTGRYGTDADNWTQTGDGTDYPGSYGVGPKGSDGQPLKPFVPVTEEPVEETEKVDDEPETIQ